MPSISPVVQGALLGTFRITATFLFSVAVGVVNDGLPLLSVTAFGLQDLRFCSDGEPTKSSGLPKPEWPALAKDGTGLTFIFPLVVVESSSERDLLASGGFTLNRDFTGS
jgi:hypothetical protein